MNVEYVRQWCRGGSPKNSTLLAEYSSIRIGRSWFITKAKDTRLENSKSEHEWLKRVRKAKAVRNKQTFVRAKEAARDPVVSFEELVSTIINQEIKKHFSLSPSSPKKIGRLNESVELCYRFAMLHCQTVTMTISFDRSGELKTELKEPFEPVLFCNISENPALSFFLLDWLARIFKSTSDFEKVFDDSRWRKLCRNCGKKLQLRGQEKKFCSYKCRSALFEWTKRISRRDPTGDAVKRLIVSKLAALFKEN
jgi:hypothetical protein